eukprot:SAG31_NODE_4089_length_3600_cov_8.534704_4_plen_200_part_01
MDKSVIDAALSTERKLESASAQVNKARQRAITTANEEDWEQVAIAEQMADAVRRDNARFRKKMIRSATSRLMEEDTGMMAATSKCDVGAEQDHDAELSEVSSGRGDEPVLVRMNRSEKAERISQLRDEMEAKMNAEQFDECERIATEITAIEETPSLEELPECRTESTKTAITTGAPMSAVAAEAVDNAGTTVRGPASQP